MASILEPQILLSTKRHEIVDCSYWGSIFLANSKGIYKQIGYDKTKICFMRSLAKPIQTSIIADCNIINDYKLEDKEIAIFCASHSGSRHHIKILKNIIKKHKLKVSDLELVCAKPLDLRGFNGRKTKLHNNCSAKHIMMMLVCKYLGFDSRNYTNENHPLQKLILKKQNELSNYNSTILTYDGCSTPLWGLPFEKIIESYYSLFHNRKYDIIIKSIINNPYTYGGHDRLDTEIIQLSKKRLFSKVGAGGFIIVYNFSKDEILLIKLTQNNNAIRKLITLDILNKLGWVRSEVSQWEYNQKKQKVAKYCYEFQI